MPSHHSRRLAKSLGNALRNASSIVGSLKPLASGKRLDGPQTGTFRARSNATNRAGYAGLQVELTSTAIPRGSPWHAGWQKYGSEAADGDAFALGLYPLAEHTRQVFRIVEH